MKNVLVTGVNGFVGQHTAQELYQSGLTVVGVGGLSGNTEKPKYISEYITADLMDTHALKNLNFSEINGVLHLAGLAAVGPSFDDPRQYMETNVGIEVNLFEAALDQGAYPKFVIVSSGSLYDPIAPLPITESSPVRPNSPYAVSKLSQEQMAQYYASRGFEVVLARPFNHIGPGQNPGFIVPDLAQQVVALERGETKEILVGNLDAKRDYTDVRDIARAYRFLLESGKSGETYNICTGRALSGHEILDYILRAAGVQPSISQDPSKMRPSDAPVLYGSHQKITADTGWKPKIDILTTLQDVIADWRTRQ